MPAGNCNFVIEQGATWIQPVQFQDSTGANRSIANHTIRMQARTSPSSNTTILNLSTTNGNITITSAANGTCALIQSAEMTSNLTAGSYVFDLKLIKPDGTVTRELSGTLTVTPEVTR